MSNIITKVAQIRDAVFGSDVRENIASGIEAINAEVENTTARQNIIDENETIRITAEDLRLENETARAAAEILRENTTEAIKLAYDNATKANLSVEVSNARGTYPTLPDRLNNVDSHLAEKAKQVDVDNALNNIGISQINKNKGLIDQTYLSDTLKAQIAGTTAIGSTPPDNSITLQKTTFAEFGTNLFNKNDVSAVGYYIQYNTGLLLTLPGFISSGFIPANPGTSYIAKYSRNFAFYDENKTFISGVNLSSGQYTNPTFTTPVNARYIRFSWDIASCSVDIQRINLGTTLLAYEDYKIYIPKEYQEKQDITFTDLSSVVTNGTNKFDKSQATISYFVSQSTGLISGNTLYDVSDYIEVVDNNVYSLLTDSNTRIAYYDSNKTFISGAYPTVSPITTPPNAKYVRYSFSHEQLDSQQFNLGTILPTYEPYGYKFIKELPSKKDLIVEMILPSKIYALVGKELNIYFDNVMNDKDIKYDFDVTCSIGSQFENYFRVTPAIAGTYPITIKAYQDNIERATISSSIIVSASTVGNGANKKVLVIGDSTTANSIAVTKLNENFNTDVMDITTIGTKGTAPNKHEGISGWTTNLFCTDPTSPFVFGGVFNFSQYISVNSLASPDYVVINLGINDVFNGTENIATILSQYNAMIDSIKAYNANIKIGIAITIPPNYSQDSFGRSYNNNQTRWRCKQNNYIWIKALINAFTGREANKIYLIPINTNLDTKNNFPYDEITPTVPVNARNTTTTVKNFATNAGVHPDTSGYWQIADVYWYWLKSFEL